MTPAEFIDRLHRHYSKRHDSVQQQTVWLREMVDCVKGTDPRLLDTAFNLIRDEHEERAFPLPATLKRYIARAGEIVYPDSYANRGLDNHNRPTRKAHVDPAMAEIYRQAAIWQQRVYREYGSWANHWRATRHLRVGERHAKALDTKYVPPAALKDAKPRRIIARSRLPRVDRVAMEALQRRAVSPIHVDITKRITGERE